MTAKILLCLPAALILSACEGLREPELPPPPGTGGRPKLFKTPEEAPRKADARTDRYPAAEIIKDRPGMVRSPYTGQVVDVSDVPQGGMAEDPSVSWEKRYFRMP